MCLITFAYKSHPEYSLILLANRDEFYARPSKAMHFWQDHPNVLAGKDLEQGGTWLGINQQGKFTAVTNYRDGLASKENALSRGALTRDFLTSDQDPTGYLKQLLPKQDKFGDYNLLIGDQSGIYYQSNREGPIRALNPGIYGLSNALLDSPWPKLIKVRSELTNVLGDIQFSPRSLLKIMSNRTQAETSELPDTHIPLEWEQLLSSSFIQSENYGTRATTLLLQKPNGETTIIEKSFGPDGFEKEQSFELKIPAIGSDGD
ncbi:MAG: NRDE family protein [Neptuniibacter sp.]